MSEPRKFFSFLPKIDWFKVFLILMALSGFLIIGFIFGFYHYNFPFLTDDNELWAHFGDFVGGTLSSIFSFLTFLAILYTLHLQREELSLNREELRLNRKELETANQEAGNQTQIARNQLENSIKQKNEEYLLQYMHMYSQIEGELKHQNFPNKTGAELLEAFCEGTIGKIIPLNILGDSIERNNQKIANKPIFKYLNCLEYLIYWDLLQVQTENLNTQPIANHRSFSSIYAAFIKSFCNDETFNNLDKSGILLKMKIVSQFPNIARFTSRVNIPK
ncbi:hypothetical protein [Leptospira bandrabouensis]|uniref:Phage abortive infection protein n=1 Tax=Leptospira bandrabouensis TaxID=2484903 RepID=A0A6H3NR61_9LEPT|nr:hypothetical protein [Leptospira bandrabouensis]TGN13478.1 hypothetical protein EHR08_11520 [Leptospira bandrabouensis]